MTKTADIVWYGKRNIVITMAIAACGLLMATVSIAQVPGFYPGGTIAGTSSNIEVVAIQGMRFPCLSRRDEHKISYTDIAAGQFEVRGCPGRDVRIRISVKGSASGGSSVVDTPDGPDADGANMPVGVGPRDVAISKDNGVTWIPINDVDLDFVTRFPIHGIAGVSTILVRIGANIVAGSDQQRGQYCGRIRLTAGYVAD
mgnify:CR=1 FL=1